MAVWAAQLKQVNAASQRFFPRNLQIDKCLLFDAWGRYRVNEHHDLP
jgi:hypothetical protein